MFQLVFTYLYRFYSGFKSSTEERCVIEATTLSEAWEEYKKLRAKNWSYDDGTYSQCSNFSMRVEYVAPSFPRRSEFASKREFEAEQRYLAFKAEEKALQLAREKQIIADKARIEVLLKEREAGRIDFSFEELMLMPFLDELPF